MRRSGLAPLALYLVWLTALPAGTIPLTTQPEQRLWQQLSSGGTVSLGGSVWAWRGDQQLVLNNTATITGPGTLFLDTTTTVIKSSFNGANLTLTNLTVFYSSSVLASISGPALPASAGPLPAVNISGVALQLMGVTLMAPFGALASVAGFWSAPDVLAALSALDSSSPGSAGSLTDGPRQILSYSSPGVSISNAVLLPTDPKPAAADCYSGGVAVYDSASMRTALGDPQTRSVFVYQDLLLSPADFTFSRPVHITGNRSVELYGCNGTIIDSNYNWTRFSVLVEKGGALSIRNLTFVDAPSVNQLFWPRRLPPLLGLVYLNLAGTCALTSVTIISPDLADLLSYLAAFNSSSATFLYPHLTPASLPTYTALNSSFAHIARWRLPGDAVWPKSPGVTPAVAAASVWDLTDVTVYSQPFTSCLSSRDFPGVKVSTGAQLRQLIGDPDMGALEIVSNITFVASEWPPEASGPAQGQIFVNATKEIYACPPGPGQRYTIDFGNLGQVVFVFGTLRFRGALMMTNPRASPRRAWLYLLIGALSVETDGVILFDRVAIHSHVPSPFNNADDPFWSISCGSLCGSFIPPPGSYLNVTYYDAFIFDYRFHKTEWVAVSQGRNITGAGFWGYTDVSLTWAPESSTPSGGGGGGGGKSVPVAAIAVPVAVGGALLLAGIAGFIIWSRRRAAAFAAAAAKAVPYRTNSGTSTAPPGVLSSKGEVSLPLPPGSTMANPPANSTTFSQGMSAMSGTVPTEARIEDMKRVITSQSALAGIHRNEQITLTELLGEGTFGKVYRGTWRGTTVAVKTMVLPANMSGKEKREKMAVMETAISSSLSHPNIVQTYTYAVLPVKGDGVGGNDKLAAGASLTVDSTSPLATMASTDAANVHSWEVRLVLEFCDRGSLRDVLNEAVAAALKAKGLPVPASLEGEAAARLAAAAPAAPLASTQQPRQLPALPEAEGSDGALQEGEEEEKKDSAAGGSGGAGDGGPTAAAAAAAAPSREHCPLGYQAVLDVSLDIARAMLHMHSENIVHGDLKARNILLKSGGPDGRPYVAKVADFGLSLRIDPHETHVSNVYQGTITHMAPEVLLHGKISKLSDVYAFAILMWETYTAGQAFKGTPRALLGHEVTKMNRRPQFPLDTPFEFQLLACRCWESDFSIRPNFEQIIEELTRMRAKLAAGAGGAGAGAPFGAPRPASGSSGSGPSGSGDPAAAAAAAAAGGGGMAMGMILGPGSMSASASVSAIGPSVTPLPGAGPAVMPSYRPGALPVALQGGPGVSEPSVTLEGDTGPMLGMSALNQGLFVMQGIDGSSMGMSTTTDYMMAGRSTGTAAGGTVGIGMAARTPAMPPILETPGQGPAQQQ